MKSFIHFSWLTNQIQYLFHDPLNVFHGSIIELSWYVSIMWCFIGNSWPMKVVQFNSWAMKHLELFFHENFMATDEVMKNYFARFIGHEMMFMVFSSYFHGIFTNLSFIVAYNANQLCDWQSTRTTSLTIKVMQESIFYSEGTWFFAVNEPFHGTPTCSNKRTAKQLLLQIGAKKRSGKDTHMLFSFIYFFESFYIYCIPHN